MANRNPNPATRFKAGAQWSGNPGGRPVHKPLTDALRRLLDKRTDSSKPTNPPKSATGWDRVAQAWVAKMMSGDMNALKLALDRLEGKVPDALTILDERQPEAPKPRFELLTDKELDFLHAHRR